MQGILDSELIASTTHAVRLLITKAMALSLVEYQGNRRSGLPFSSHTIKRRLENDQVD